MDGTHDMAAQAIAAHRAVYAHPPAAGCLTCVMRIQKIKDSCLDHQSLAALKQATP